MRYRYITCGITAPDDALNKYRLIGAINIGSQSSAIRVTLPDDIELEKWDPDGYSTTTATIKLRELDPKVIVRFNKQMKTDNTLTALWLENKIQPYEFCQYFQKQGFVPSQYGYLTWTQFKNRNSKN